MISLPLGHAVRSAVEPSLVARIRRNSGLWRVAFPATCAALFTGCASQYRMEVDALNSAEIGYGYAYRLKPDRAVSAQSPELIRQVERDIETALSSRGYYPAPEGVEPEIVIDYGFGMIGPFKKIKHRSETVTVTMPSSSGSPVMSGGHVVGMPAYTGNPNIEKQETVAYTVETYRKYLELTARKVESGTRADEKWTILISNDDQSRDLVRYTRLMTAAAMDMIGRQTDHFQTVVLTDHDGRVIFIEEGMAASEEAVLPQESAAGRT